MQDTAAELLSLPDEVEADSLCPGGGGEKRIFDVDAAETVVAFFLPHHAKRAAAFYQINLACDASCVGY